MEDEDKEDEFYHPTDEEWPAIQEGVAQAARGEFVPQSEMDAFWKRHLG